MPFQFNIRYNLFCWLHHWDDLFVIPLRNWEWGRKLLLDPTFWDEVKRWSFNSVFRLVCDCIGARSQHFAIICSTIRCRLTLLFTKFAETKFVMIRFFMLWLIFCHIMLWFSATDFVQGKNNSYFASNNGFCSRENVSGVTSFDRARAPRTTAQCGG